MVLLFKKILCGLMLLLVSEALSAQITVGNLDQTEPFSVLQLAAEKVVGGLRLPQITLVQRDALTTESFKSNPKAVGLAVFNSTDQVINYWNGSKWITVNLSEIHVAGLDGTSAAFTGGTPVHGSPFVGTMTVSYTGGNGYLYPSMRVSSTGVRGLVAILRASTLANGNGTLVFDISGTPVYDGTDGYAQFSFVFGGQSCIAKLNVLGVVALNPDAVTVSGVQHGTSNVNATMDVNLPYIKGSGAAYNAGTAIASTGVSGMTLTLQAGTLQNLTDGSLSFKLSGTPVYTGTANYALFNFSFAGKTATIKVPVVGITGLDVSGTLIVGNGAKSGTAYTGVLKVPYSKGSGQISRYVASFNSTGVTGLTATLRTGQTLNSFASGYLLFDVTGTPASNGTASFAINVFGISATVTQKIGCPGYLATNSKYLPRYPANNYMGSLIANESDKRRYRMLNNFIATGGSICFYKTDGSASGANYADAVAKCANGSYADGTTGWRLPNLAELAAVQPVYNTLSTQLGVAPGTTNMNGISTDIMYWSISQYADCCAWLWYFKVPDNQGGYGFFNSNTKTSKAGVRCVADY